MLMLAYLGNCKHTYPGKMSEQPEKRAKLERMLLGAIDRYLIFTQVYNGAFTLNPDDELFKKNSEELGLENTKYGRYLTELENAEREAKMKQRKRELEFEKAEQELEMKQREIDNIKLEKFKEAEIKFISKVGDDFSRKELLTEVCKGLGSLLYLYLDGELTIEQKVNFAKKVESIVSQKHGFGVFRALMNRLDGFNEIKLKSVVVPLKSNGSARAPSSITGSTQVSVEKDNQNFIYPYPFDVTAHFPVYLCHSVFGKFMNIVKNQENASGDLTAFNQFMSNNVIASKVDKCLSKLIPTVLDVKQTNLEDKFVDKIVDALKELFPEVKIGAQAQAESQTRNVNPVSSKVRMDASIEIRKFPFIIIEAKHTSYSINAVLQGLQYYGITMTKDFIDNNPCFLFAIDKGFLFIYGVATVNYRIVCTCLISLEFTNYHLNANDFMGTLYRCIGALYYFHENFKERITNDTKDQSHEDYLKHKIQCTTHDQPYPAIFKVKGIGIEFKDVVSEHQAYFKPCVVKTADGRDAVLKVANNYDIASHLKLQEEGISLAPRILANDVLDDNYHVILMEYLGDTHDTLFNVMTTHGSDVDQELLSDSLKNILGKLESLNIVHGDFRSCNILVKKPQLHVQAQDEDEAQIQDETQAQAQIQGVTQNETQVQVQTPNQTKKPTIILEDFKLIDFEFSGKEGHPYPVLSMKNPAIEWHSGFNSYMPREHAHDLHMFNMMKSKGYKN